MVAQLALSPEEEEDSANSSDEEDPNAPQPEPRLDGLPVALVLRIAMSPRALPQSPTVPSQAGFGSVVVHSSWLSVLSILAVQGPTL